MTWVAIAIGVLFLFLAAHVAVSAERYDRKMHVKGKLSSWNHIEVMAGYYTAVTVLGAIGLVVIVIATMGGC